MARAKGKVYCAPFEKHKDEVEKMLDNGFKIEQIALYYGCSIKTIHMRLEHWGLLHKTFSAKKKEKAAQLEEWIVDVCPSILTPAEVAEKLGYNLNSVYGILYRNGVKIRDARPKDAIPVSVLETSIHDVVSPTEISIHGKVNWVVLPIQEWKRLQTELEDLRNESTPDT